MPINSYEDIDLNSEVVVALASWSFPADCFWTSVQAIGGDVRYTMDGSDPSPVRGMLLKAGRVYKFKVADAKRMRLISTTGSRVLNLHYAGKDKTPIDEQSSVSSASSLSTSSSSISTSSSSRSSKSTSSSSSSSRSSISTSSSSSSRSSQSSQSSSSSSRSSASSLSTSSSSSSTVVPPPSAPTNGVFDNTAYGYASRDAGTVTGINYQQDWSVELAVDCPKGAFTGDYGELFGHRRDASTFNAARPGWSFCYMSNGYSTMQYHALAFSYSDGSGNNVERYTSGFNGKRHFIATYDVATKTLAFYENGALVSSVTNAAMVHPASIPYELVLGGNNKTACSTTPANEYAFNTYGNAMPEHKTHLARIWQKKITAAEAASLYANWNGLGRVDIPSDVTGTPVTEYLFHEQVGSSAGAPGTGYIKDSRGGNHLKIVNTNSVTGASGPAPSLLVPSGSVRISNVSNGATGVAAGITLRADGLWGTGAAMQYWIEVDEDPTFTGPLLMQSGWLLSDGQWRPALKPGTVYFARVKARNGNNTGSVSSWSSSITFATRNAQAWYCRPYAAPGAYGAGDGTSRATAFNGLRWQGVKGYRDAPRLQQEGDLRKLSPGDTLWLQDTWGPFDMANAGPPDSTSPYYFGLVGEGRASHPIVVRGDDPTYPFKFFNCLHPTQNWGWVNEGGGVFSTTTYWTGIGPGGLYVIFDTNADGVPDVGTAIEDKTYADQGAGPLTGAGYYISGGKLYVRMPDDASPANRLHYVGGYNTLSVYGTHIKLQGGSIYGTGFYHGLSTNVTVSATTFKYHNGYPLTFRKNVDDWVIEDCDISRAGAGVYGLNNGEGNCGNRTIIRRNWIHHIGIGKYSDGDSHCVGIQAGIDWTVEDNLCEYSGSAIEQWSTVDLATGLIIRRNVVRKTSARSPNTFASALTFSNGPHKIGMRTGHQILHNVCYDTDGSNIHDSNTDLKDIKWNLLVNAGLNPADNGYTRNYHSNVPASASEYDGGPAVARPGDLRFKYNVCVNPNTRYFNGGGDGTGFKDIDENLYWDAVDTAATADKFRHPGVNSGTAYSFNGWKATGLVDANSYFENPLTSLHLPTGFDPLMVKFFCGTYLGDVDASGAAPNAADLAYYDAFASGDGARTAARKLLQNLIAYGSY